MFEGANKAADSTAIVPRLPTVRSKKTNGRARFVAEGDGRSGWSRRQRDLVELHCDDLGGVAVLSEAQLSLCRRAATLECELERLEGLLSTGEEVDLDLYGRISGQLRRILETLGVQRAKRDVTPSLDAIIAEHAREAAA
jgi:hypothetical protein